MNLGWLFALRLNVGFIIISILQLLKSSSGVKRRRIALLPFVFCGLLCLSLFLVVEMDPSALMISWKIRFKIGITGFFVCFFFFFCPKLKNQNKALINIVGLTDISGIDTRIITASVGGLLQLWDFNTHSILANVKAHPDFISFCYVPGGDLYTVGTDKQISVWNTSNLQRKLGRKCSNVCALEAFPHSNVGSHKFILATSDSLSCFVSDCESGSGQVLFNLSSFSQSLRRPKITSISVSKIHPERIFVAINKCVLFAVEWGKRFLPSPQFARMGSPTDSEVWTESKGHIWRTSYNGILTNVHSTSKKCGCWHDQVLSAPSGVLSRSFDDTFACVFCPEEGRFTIFRTLNWSVLMKNTEQNVVDFVWSSNCNRAAMVVMKNSSAILKASSASGTSPSSSSPLGSIIPRGSGSSRNNSKLDVLQYACVSILDVDSDGEIIWNGKMTSGYVPRISGGALLGIWKQDALNFYSWNGDMCGRADEQPPVSYLLWEDAKIDGTSRCLTVVDGTTHVYDTKPEFHCIRSFSNLPIIDALWYEDSVFYCTDSDIGVIFPTVDSWPACVIASHTLESCGGPYSTSAKCMKPFGMNKLVGVFEDNLLLVAADFSVKRVSLASPVLQFFLTTANKSLKQAMEKASNIDPMWYERVARFAAGCDENVKSSNQILDEEMYGMTYGEKLEFLEALINGK